MGEKIRKVGTNKNKVSKDDVDLCQEHLQPGTEYSEKREEKEKEKMKKKNKQKS
jgi:hypothetical protein